MSHHWQVPPHALTGYDAIIDVRSPSEFALDHIPGAINCPVLDDDERARVGTLYKQVSPFEARKLGAVLIARRIAQHIQQHWHDYPKHWRPLIYCWRGGQRSGAMQTVLRQIGWQADRIEGGYKAFRHHVIADTAQRLHTLRLCVLCGATGSAKTRILHAIAAQGGQVLNLEALAAHKGSVLGEIPQQRQPGQKWFETRIWHQLRTLEAHRPVFVEAESRKIGLLHLPDALLAALHQSPCVEIQATLDARVDFLLRDYPHACNVPWMHACLERLLSRQGRTTIGHWKQLASDGQWAELVRALLQQHYDPLYRQSQRQHYQHMAHATPQPTNDLSDTAIAQLARKLLAQEADWMHCPTP